MINFQLSVARKVEKNNACIRHYNKQQNKQKIMFRKITYTTNVVSYPATNAFVAYVNIKCDKRLYYKSCNFYTTKLLGCHYSSRCNQYEKDGIVDLFQNTNFQRNIVFRNESKYATYQYNISNLYLQENSSFVITGYEKFEPIKMILRGKKNEELIINITRSLLRESLSAS
jgi:hypothetical protein